MKTFTIEGNIVNIDKTLRARVEIDQASGLITKVGELAGQADLVLQEELIFPGFVDLHVHAREDASHTQDYKEDFISAGLAAINGGVAAFADMPNNPIPPVDDKSYAGKRELAKKSPVEVLLYAGIGKNTKPLSLSFRAVASESRNPLNNAGSTVKGSLLSSSDALVVGRDDIQRVPYKVYLGQSVGDLFFDNKENLETALKNYQNQNVSFHCEDPEILSSNKDKATHAERRSEQAEISAIDFALQMIEKYQLNGKICHCSTAKGLEKIIAAKKRRVKVTVEVTPHHLYFDDSVIASSAKQSKSSHQIASSDALLAMTRLFQVNPPIRQSKENRLALVAALKNGDIDYLATDHAPHTLEEKAKGMSGLPHLDTYGPFVTWLMKEHKFTPQDIARVCAYNPGQFISQFLSQSYGKIEQGFVGSLSVIDMNKPSTITKSQLKTKCGWSPFEGVEFPGSVVATIIRGKIFKCS